MPLEIERKYLGCDLEQLREKLRANAARFLGCHFEHNDVFETDPPSLTPASSLLRLRTCVQKGEGFRHFLTLKLPVQSESSCKVREEREVSVADAAMMRSILAGLGYFPQASYEKVREVWRLQALELVIDTLPFMTAVEMEGSEEEIVQCESLLGLAEIEVSTASYHELHQQWLRERGLPPALSFVFSDNDRAQKLAELGLEAHLVFC